MALTAYYSAGTATLTNGSAAVVGIGTAWTTNNLAPGDQIESDAGERATILTINGPTSITLDKNFAGTTQAAAPYKIWRTFDAQYLMEGARNAFNLLGSGSVAALAALAGAADKGMYFTAPNVLALFSLTAAGRALLDDDDASAQLTTLGFSAFFKTLVASASKVVLQASIGVREVLTANRTYYVGFNMGAATVSIATPGVVTKAAHGLVADSRISFAILPNTKTATVSVGAPAVVTMANTFAAGQPIKFETTGRLPKGLVAGTTYFVIATGLSGASFQISATVGGAAINTSNPAVTVSNASPGVVTEAGHGRSVGDAIQLATTGALPTGLSPATTYFVKTVLDANTYTLSAAPEDAAINTSSAGAGTHTIVQFGTHYLSETGTLPTGITAGQDYFVLATGLTADTFRFSATSGGAAINTSGSTAGTISLKTGSDNASGLNPTQADALLSTQAALNKIMALDLGVFNVAIQQADGTYLGTFTMNAPVVGTGTVTVQGNSTTPNNVFNSINGYAFTAQNNAVFTVKDCKIGAVGFGLYALTGGIINYSNINFAASGIHMHDESGGVVQNAGSYMISGGAQMHWDSGLNGSTLAIVGATISLVNVPAFSGAFARAHTNGALQCNTNIFVGYATGARYLTSAGGAIQTFGGGPKYLPGSNAGSGTGYV